MDPEAFLDLANQVTKLKMFPYFEIAHVAITCLYVREDLGAGAHLFSRKHPLSCWVSCMFSTFAGVFLANFLLGEPILDGIKSNNQILLATAVWYAIFYSPFDIVYKIAKFLPVKIVLSALKEVIRCKKVHDGVVHAAKIYPSSYLIMVLIGTVKGNGAGFTKVIERYIRGIWNTSGIEFVTPSFPTKASLVAAVIFVLDKKTDYISAPHALVYFGVVLFFVYFKLSSILLGIHDPFGPFENLFCAVFMGGIWDTLSSAISSSKADASVTAAAKAKEAKEEAAKKKE